MARPKGSTNKTKEEVKEVEEVKVKKAVKKTEEAVETVEVEEVEELSMAERFKQSISEGKDRGVKKAKKVVFDADDMVPVASFASGLTKLTNDQAPYDQTIWDGFGSIEDVRYGTLDYIRKRKPDAFKAMLYVLDEDVIKSLSLTPIYKKIGKLEEIIDIFNQPLDRVLTFIDKSNKEVKNVLKEILTNKLERKEDISLFTAKAIAEKLGMELNLDV